MLFHRTNKSHNIHIPSPTRLSLEWFISAQIMMGRLMPIAMIGGQRILFTCQLCFFSTERLCRFRTSLFVFSSQWYDQKPNTTNIANVGIPTYSPQESLKKMQTSNNNKRGIAIKAEMLFLLLNSLRLSSSIAMSMFDILSRYKRYELRAKLHNIIE